MIYIKILRRVLFFLCLLVFFSAKLGFAFEEETKQQNSVDESAKLCFELDEIVVTATKDKQEIRDIPKNVTVITSKDIAQATSNNVVDLLAREAGVNLKSYYGHDKFSSIDLRGMGATSTSNVIVMVDGYRLNASDLSGPDFSSVPLNQIERIEIVRGAGSVVYGDGAVGGVINIITKKGTVEPEARLYSSFGSYSTYDQRASWQGAIKNLFLNANAGYYDSNGYRSNGYTRKKDAGLNLGYYLKDYLFFNLNAAHHEDSYGLPGPVSKEDVDSTQRRKSTKFPDDSGDTKDQRIMGGVEIELANLGHLKINGGYRFRDNYYIMGYNPLLSKATQESHIYERSKNFDCKYDISFPLLGFDHKLLCGIDHFKTRYYREELSGKKRENSEVENIGIFFMNQCSLTKKITLTYGYRHNSYRGKFRHDELKKIGSAQVWLNGEIRSKKWKKNLFDTGIVYSFAPVFSLYANYATSFRIPNVDEFAAADEDLAPQKGKHLEIGSRHNFMDKLEITINFYQIIIDDEIYYGRDPVTGASLNRNYDDRTVRRGIEAEFKIYPADCLYLWGNYSYTSAKFDTRNTQVPLVPRHKITAGLEWQITDHLVLALTGTRVGSRYDGNDEQNCLYSKLDAYEVVDGKVSYTCKGFKIYAGANNVFNELYSTVSYSETFYPMPTGNYYGGVEWAF